MWVNGHHKIEKMVDLPVSTHIHTMKTDNENDSSSAAVNLPHIPNEILLPSEHGRMIYWHMGSRRNARATVAITATEPSDGPHAVVGHLLAVQMAKSICIESKKKNITSSEMLAPRGKHSACMVSSVCTLLSVCACCEGLSRQLVLPLARSRASCSMLRLRKEP